MESLDYNIFGLLIIKTVDNETIMRPIGGVYGNIINDTITESDKKYPGCMMKLLLENNTQKYLASNGIDAGRAL